MDVISRNRSSSTLNPNAPMFVPYAYRAVEDFSDEWWALVQSLPWFRDYWLQECFHDPQDDLLFPESGDRLLPDIDSLFDEFEFEQKEKEGDEHRDLISLGALKWRKPRFPVGTPKCVEKAPKIVNKKVSPRPIQQPR